MTYISVTITGKRFIVRARRPENERVRYDGVIIAMILPSREGGREGGRTDVEESSGSSARNRAILADEKDSSAKICNERRWRARQPRFSQKRDVIYM